MITRRRLLTMVGASGLTLAASRAGSTRSGTPPYPGSGIHNVGWGQIYKYNNGYPTKYIISDVFVSTWANDDKLYLSNDDSQSWQNGSMPNGSNMEISLFTPGTTGNVIHDYTDGLVGSSINLMTPLWGTLSQNGSDGKSFKSWGPISVGGTLYTATSRQFPTTITSTGTAARWPENGGQIIKSADHGVTWSPQPPSNANPYASPQFGTGTVNTTCSWIQYGKDYAGNTVDNSDQYVYAVSNDGFWNNGSNLYLGRVSIANIGNLSAGDWSFYQGGGDPGTWGAWSSAAAIINNPYKVSSGNVVYLPALQAYVYIGWWYTSAVPSGPVYDSSSTVWDLWWAPKPWGPWTMLSGASVTWNMASGFPGLYNPAIIPKTIAADGGHNVVLATSGDWSNLDTGPGGTHGLMLMPVSFW